MINSPRNGSFLVKGTTKSDRRGSVTFINDFTFRKIKRFYVVENVDTSIIRGFHGHMKEAKYTFVVSGRALLCTVYLDHPFHPSKINRVERFTLSSEQPTILYIPPRHANGFRALKKNTKIIFFSTLSLKDSLKDDYRFPPNYWGKEVWKSNE